MRDPKSGIAGCASFAPEMSSSDAPASSTAEVSAEAMQTQLAAMQTQLKALQQQVDAQTSKEKKGVKRTDTGDPLKGSDCGCFTGEPWKWSDCRSIPALPPKWQTFAFEDGKEPLESPGLCSTVKCLLHRLHWVENQRRVDRKDLDEVVKKSAFYEEKHKEVLAVVEEVYSSCNKLQVIVLGKPFTMANLQCTVREMTVVEKRRLLAALRNLTKEKDAELLADVQRVVEAPASKSGTLDLSSLFDKLSATQLWTLWYLCIQRDGKRPVDKESAKRRAINAAPASSVSVSPASSSFVETRDDNGDEEDDSVFEELDESGGF